MGSSLCNNKRRIGKMKSKISLLALSIALTSPALSNAGPAPVAPIQCPEVEAEKWGGFAVGVHVGYGHLWEKKRTSGTPYKQVIGRGSFGGFHGGYDLLIQKNWVLGLETSFDWSEYALGCKWNVAVIPKIGYVSNDSIIYVGAGWFGSQTPGFVGGLRLVAGVGKKFGRVLVAIEADHDAPGKKHTTIAGKRYTLKEQVVSAQLKLSYEL
jgi:opacity protein-like surface antigen